MTDNDIKKALECCCKGDKKDCFECPLQNSWDCHKELREKALDLINRQQAEIERLKVERDKEHDYCNHYVRMCAKAKSEAIKEFAEKLKENFNRDIRLYGNCTVYEAVQRIDVLVKEMTEEEGIE